jgi:hypothetical protein
MKFLFKHQLLTFGLVTLLASVAQAKKPTTGNEFFDSGTYELTLGNYTTYGHLSDSKNPRFNGKKTAGFSNAYLHAFYETAQWNKLQLGVGFHGNGKLWGVHDTYGEMFDHEYYIYNSDLYLKYNFTDKTYLQGGRFNTRNISNHLDPQYGQGFRLDFNEVENLRVQLGIFTRFAYFWEDGFGDYEKIDSESRYDELSPVAKNDIGSELYMVEMTYSFSDDIWIDPYFYHQSNYVNWYGLDVHLGQSTDWGSYGTTIYAYQVDPLFDSNDPSEQDNSFNWSFKPFINIGKTQFDLGYAKFGSNAAVNRPNYTYKYLTDILYRDNQGTVEIMDKNTAYGKENCQVYFGRINYQEERWNIYITAAQFDTEDDDVLELQVGASYSITDDLRIGSRIVDLAYAEDTTTYSQDMTYIEAWLFYDF